MKLKKLFCTLLYQLCVTVAKRYVVGVGDATIA